MKKPLKVLMKRSNVSDFTELGKRFKVPANLDWRGLMLMQGARWTEFKPYVKEFEEFWEKNYKGDIKTADNSKIASALYKYTKAEESPRAVLSEFLEEIEPPPLTKLKKVKRHEVFKPPKQKFETSTRFTFLKGLLRYKKGYRTAYAAFIICLARYFGVPAMAFKIKRENRTGWENEEYVCSILQIEGDEEKFVDPLTTKNVHYSGEIITDNTLTAEAWRARGNLLKKMKKPHAALKCFNNAIKFDPSNADLWCTKAIHLHDLGDFPMALKCFNKAIGLNPKHANAWFNKALTDGMLNQKKAAHAALRKAKQLMKEQGLNKFLEIAKGYEYVI